MVKKKDTPQSVLRQNNKYPHMHIPPLISTKYVLFGILGHKPARRENT